MWGGLQVGPGARVRLHPRLDASTTLCGTVSTIHPTAADAEPVATVVVDNDGSRQAHIAGLPICTGPAEAITTLFESGCVALLLPPSPTLPGPFPGPSAHVPHTVLPPSLTLRGPRP